MVSYKQFTNMVLEEIMLAEYKHPEWPKDLLHQIAIVNEESGEATRAALQVVYEQGSKQELQKELVQTAAMCFRMIQHLNK